jgi:hypothetical protein
LIFLIYHESAGPTKDLVLNFEEDFKVLEKMKNLLAAMASLMVNLLRLAHDFHLLVGSMWRGAV